MFNNIYEEERLFPYLNISLEEARRLRYLISNFYFDSKIEYVDEGIDIYSEIDEIFHKRFYSIDKFRFKEKDIEVTSCIENKEDIVRHIPYPDESLQLK